MIQTLRMLFQDLWYQNCQHFDILSMIFGILYNKKISNSTTFLIFYSSSCWKCWKPCLFKSSGQNNYNTQFLALFLETDVAIWYLINNFMQTPESPTLTLCERLKINLTFKEIRQKSKHQWETFKLLMIIHYFQMGSK